MFEAELPRSADYRKVIKWAKSHFGEMDQFTRGLKDDHDTWIQRLIIMRNAVEHPGGKSGVLIINNFLESKVGDQIVVSDPTWHLEADRPVFIVDEMEIFNSNLLTFFEESLILFLETFGKPPFVALEEIPENQRRSDCPKRFQMVLARTIYNEPRPYPAPLRSSILWGSLIPPRPLQQWHAWSWKAIAGEKCRRRNAFFEEGIYKKSALVPHALFSG